ncbi:hypothetical protein Pmar_PMAR012937 [Perkinsus marinus ATCC 50983]|uniref:Uncharacterized protein n=1 Tax=Perkinsus marinus (strain ATCC 50983 / TXsc) TaxID=423536 RepID=C5LWL0_PERM5|nr:hypothetical protein Pmar_PMAR012937 [Perkinsus marinus ATCC 50983]EEQ98923.1 hypothetical protein Pmar_PMAR012937 [Perkinsus marinus ATCC 50983]|eukprot:XP_002766206.1 hypothetical protein Pmar_PMAR012937 [Perkinsus marinus ATCC 50983]
MEEAISKSVDTCSGEVQRLSAVEERGQLLSEFDFASCEMVLISVDEEENEACNEAVLRRSRLRKNTGNRLLAVGAPSEARSEYMKALSTLRLMQRPPLEEPSDEEKALELAVVLNLALLCLKQADYSEGQLFATRAREIDPDNIKARYRLALALVEQHKQTDEAVGILKVMIDGRFSYHA